MAEASKAALAASGRFKEPIAVASRAGPDFWIAEDYHQDYYMKNPANYKLLPLGLRPRRPARGAVG